MKNIFTLSILLSLTLVLNSAKATIHTVSVSSNFFSPNSLTVTVGDTILWTWSSGSHTTTSQTIPANAASWNHNMNSGSTSFQYKVTEAGSYTYHCSFHSGMTGSFSAEFGTVVTSPTGSRNFDLLAGVSSGGLQLTYVLPTPSSYQVALFDLTGRPVRVLTSGSHTAGTYVESYNISGLSSGMYFLELRAGDKMVIRKIGVD